MLRSRPLDEVAVDRWLAASLRETHAAVLREPIPEALLQLLRDDPAV